VEAQAARPATATDLPGLLGELFLRLDRDAVRWCLLRDGHRLRELAGGGEIDLLVSPGDRRRAERGLRDLRFVPRPAPGRSPHRFFFGYDEPADAWWKVDVVDRVACGRPVHALATGLAGPCLDRRRRSGPAWVPSPEDEMVALLFHCWLDKETFAPRARARLGELVRAVGDREEVSRLLADHGVALDWKRLSGAVLAGEWSILFDTREDAARGLRERDAVGTTMRALRDRALRLAGRATRPLGRRGLAVALLAPDGAGKSTLARRLRDRFPLPTRTVYMGLYRKGDAGGPGWDRFGLAGRIARQWIRWAGACWHVACGRLVVFDRYSYDAFLPPERPLTVPGRVRRRLLAACCPAPDLVFLLDVPGAVLHARTSEHTPERLEERRRQYLALRSRVPALQVVDANRDVEVVRREITGAIWRRFSGERAQAWTAGPPA